MAEQGYILAIDQGTTGTTALVVDISVKETPSVQGRCTVDFPQHYPKPGWVEHDLNEIWRSVEAAIKGAFENAKLNQSSFKAQNCVAIGITNQRETLCVFDRHSGKPLCNAIVWQCKRSTDICDRFRREGYSHLFVDKTGLVLDPYFSGTKVTWIMENDPSTAAALRNGSACLGTIDTYLIYKLSGGVSYVTEASNASRTLAYDIGKGDWDSELIQALKIPGHTVLPEVRDSAGDLGVTKGLGFLPDGVPIAGALGDQQAALAGQACFEVGEAKCTYGTGAFLLTNIGKEAKRSDHGILTTVAWSLRGELTYAFEGAAFIAGAAIQFVRDQLNFLSDSAQSEVMAKDVLGAPEVYFVPALAGLGAPHWDPRARGAFFGLTRGTSKGQMIRACLEGIAFEVNDLMVAMESGVEKPLTILRVDGGAAANDLLLQAQANFSGLPVDRPKNLETTALGSALFAGLGIGLYSDLDELTNVRTTERVFKPATTAEDKRLISDQLDGWERAVRAVRVFAGSV